MREHSSKGPQNSDGQNRHWKINEPDSLQKKKHQSWGRVRCYRESVENDGRKTKYPHRHNLEERKNQIIEEIGEIGKADAVVRATGAGNHDLEEDRTEISRKDESRNRPKNRQKRCQV